MAGKTTNTRALETIIVHRSIVLFIIFPNEVLVGVKAVFVWLSSVYWSFLNYKKTETI